MEEAADFQMDMTFLEPQIAACPPLGFPNLDNSTSSPWDSDISDSCPASPSPVSSPSPHHSSSESGIEDVSDMEETTSAFSQAVNGPLMVKMENPSSPLNAMTQPPCNTSERRKRRKGSRTPNDNSVLEELNKLLVETSMSLALTSVDRSGSQPYQSQAKITGVDDVMAGVQTMASPTSVSHSCPQSVQMSQTTALAPNSASVSSSQSTSTATVTKISSPPPVASPSRIRSKPRNARKSDEPKIVIIEEPEEVFAFDTSKKLLI